MGKKMKNPPLIEAICEFRFAPDSPWDWTLPGALYSRIGAQFPIKSQTPEMVSKSSPAGRPIEVKYFATPELVQFKKKDGAAMVQLGPGILAINHLKPYPSWERFLGLIKRVFAVYASDIGDPTLARIGLRYINRMEIPSPESNLGDFVKVAPSLPGILARPLKGFYQRYEVRYDQPLGILIHQSGIQEVEGKTHLLLDLDFGSMDVKNHREVAEIGKWLAAAHEVIYQAFVASMNPEHFKRLSKGEV